MGLMKENDIINFIYDLCYEIETESAFDLSSMVVRYGCFTAVLSDVFGMEDAETIDDLKAAFTKSEESLAEFREDNYVDIYLSCEGDFYEEAYLSEAEGETTEAGEILEKVTGEYGLTVEYCGGGLGFQCKESWDLQRKDEGWS